MELLLALVPAEVVLDDDDAEVAVEFLARSEVDVGGGWAGLIALLAALEGGMPLREETAAVEDMGMPGGDYSANWPIGDCQHSSVSIYVKEGRIWSNQLWYEGLRWSEWICR